MCCTWLAKNTGCKNDAKNRHLGTIPQLCRAISSQLRCASTIGKNLLSSSISSTGPYHMVKFGVLAAEIVSFVWGTPANFNGFRVLAALLHGTPVLGISQTLRHWTEGATYIRQGGHHVGHWPTFLVQYLSPTFPKKQINNSQNSSTSFSINNPALKNSGKIVTSLEEAAKEKKKIDRHRERYTDADRDLVHFTYLVIKRRLTDWHQTLDVRYSCWVSCHSDVIIIIIISTAGWRLQQLEQSDNSTSVICFGDWQWGSHCISICKMVPQACKSYPCTDV